MESQSETGKVATMSDYLRSWGLEMYIEKFLEQSIDVETLQMLSEADLRELVPVIGHRAKITTQIKLLTDLLMNAYQPISSPKESIDSNAQITLYTIGDLTTEALSQPLDLEDDPDTYCEVYNTLSACNEGKGLLLQYQEIGLLDNAARYLCCY